MAKTLEQLQSAVRQFYGDTSRSREETREALEELASDIEVMIESLQDED